MICKKEIINAGLKSVHMRERGIGDQTYTLDDIEKLLHEEEEKLRKNFKSK